MRPIATDGVAWSVCVSVCLSVCLSVSQVRGPCKTAEPVEMRFGALSRVCPRNHASSRGRDPLRKGAIFKGCQAHDQSIGAFCCGVRSRKDNSILNNGMTCDAAFHQNSLTSCLDSTRQLDGQFHKGLCQISSEFCT